MSFASKKSSLNLPIPKVKTLVQALVNAGADVPWKLGELIDWFWGKNFPV